MAGTGADLVVQSLERVGVEVVFGLPGVHNLPAWNALACSSIRLVVVRHEQAAVYAADGYARATGRLGVALVTTGPGAANTLAATGEAWASGSPVLVIATDIPAALRRPGVHGGALHECTDQPAMFAPVTKATFTTREPAELGALARRAATAALEAPARPTLLQIPADLLDAPVAIPSIPDEGPASAREVPNLHAAVELIAGAKRPLVWAGGGARDGAAAVAALAERLGAPILTTYSGRGIAGDHPYSLSLPPHLPRIGALWEEADLVITVGSDLDGMNTQNWRMPGPSRLLAINIDPSDAGKNYGPDVTIECDAATACRLLAERLPGEHEPWVDVGRVRVDAWTQLRTDHAEEVRFLDAFAAATPQDAIVLADMCIPGYWIAGFHRFTAPRRLEYPMGWGTLGFAFPASIGAALAGAGPVVSVSGDGGFLFACGELATIAQEGLPVTTVIVDDGGYGMLRYDQARRGARTSYGVDLRTPDYVALAKAFGLRADSVDGLGNAFAAALARHMAEPEPTVLVARAALSPPPTTSPRWYRAGPPQFAEE